MSGEDVVLGILDERTDLLLDFEQIARLHGHTMHYRVQTRFGQYEVGDGPRKNNFLPSRRADKPAPAWFEAATAMAACHLRLASNDRDNWKSFLDGIRQVLGPNRSFWLLPSPPRASAVRWPLADKGVLTLMNEAAGKEVWDRSGGFQPGGLSPDEFEDVCNFLLSRWLEIYVHGVLHAQLQTVGLPFHCAEGLRFARLDLAENGSQRPAKKDFELDVAAMLGYQLMVVSCYAGWNAKEVKMKGFEAIHRARQIGGSEAPAVMVSLAYEQEAEEVELELDAQARTFGVPIRVWHRRDLPRLDVEFDRLLGELAWKK